MTPAIEAALHRQRTVTLVALTVLAALAWIWLLLGAGTGMEAQTDLSPFPHQGADSGMTGMAMDRDASAAAIHIGLAFSMWWVMMVAMMLPAAAPVVLLYARATSGRDTEASATGSFVAGYLAAWGLFSLLAAVIQAGLARLAVLAPMTLGSSGKWFSAAVLIAAGLYQLSPLKETCLAHCRRPAAFLSRHYRPGRAGAFHMGLLHGAYCVGCCWLLMALLFVGGTMNLAWMALLTLLVAAERLPRSGRHVALAAGLAFIAWGVATALA